MGLWTCVEVFEVYLMQSSNLKSSGECLLQVTADSIQLLDIENPQRVQLTWPLSAIRRYTVERGMFSLEAGRSLSTVCRHFIQAYITTCLAHMTACDFQQFYVSVMHRYQYIFTYL